MKEFEHALISIVATALLLLMELGVPIIIVGLTAIFIGVKFSWIVVILLWIVIRTFLDVNDAVGLLIKMQNKNGS